MLKRDPQRHRAHRKQPADEQRIPVQLLVDDLLDRHRHHLAFCAVPLHTVRDDLGAGRQTEARALLPLGEEGLDVLGLVGSGRLLTKRC